MFLALLYSLILGSVFGLCYASNLAIIDGTSEYAGPSLFLPISLDKAAIVFTVGPDNVLLKNVTACFSNTFPTTGLVTYELWSADAQNGPVLQMQSYSAILVFSPTPTYFEMDVSGGIDDVLITETTYALVITSSTSNTFIKKTDGSDGGYTTTDGFQVDGTWDDEGNGWKKLESRYYVNIKFEQMITASFTPIATLSPTNFVPSIPTSNSLSASFTAILSINPISSGTVPTSTVTTTFSPKTFVPSIPAFSSLAASFTAVPSINPISSGTVPTSPATTSSRIEYTIFTATSKPTDNGTATAKYNGTLTSAVAPRIKPPLISSIRNARMEARSVTITLTKAKRSKKHVGRGS